MKKLLLTITLSFIISCSFAQWELYDQIPTDVGLVSISFIDNHNGWAAGNIPISNYKLRIILLHTNDAGITWEELDLEDTTSNRLVDLFFIDNKHGWGVGTSHVDESDIYRTNDGGLNWQYTHSVEEFNAIFFSDTLNGWVVGWDGTIFHTMNGGVDWVDESIGDYTLNFTDVFFTNLSHGWIIGTKWDQGIRYGKIYHTNNGGITWEEHYSIINGYLNKGCFIGSDKVWVIGDGIILHTSDGGINWQQQTIEVPQLNSIYFSDADHGWAVGDTNIIHTTDGGLSWNNQTSGVYNSLNCVAFFDNDNGWIVGYDGVMLHTTNGGISDHCLPEGITFSTQAQIDSFQILYPNCTEIEGDVKILGDQLTNLNGLNSLTNIWGDLRIGSNNLKSLSGLEGLTSVWGDLRIYYTDSLVNLTGLDNISNIGGMLLIRENHFLETLEGLNGLSNIGGDLSIIFNRTLSSCFGLEELGLVNGDCYIWGNDKLQNLNGLESLDTIRGRLNIGDYHPQGGYWNNPILTNVDGLEKLTFIGGDLYLIANTKLDNISGFNGLTAIEGSLHIAQNDSLMSLMGLNNLTSISGDLYIYSNDTLMSLAGIENIVAAGIINIYVSNNNRLNECDVLSMCNYFISPNGTITIQDNAEGCNSQQEVEEVCASSIHEVGAINAFTVSPNPFTSTTALSYDLKQPSAVDFRVFNQLGQLVYQHSEEQAQGAQQLLWNAQGQAEGIYYYRLQVGDQIANGKMVKVR